MVFAGGTGRRFVCPVPTWNEVRWAQLSSPYYDHHYHYYHYHYNRRFRRSRRFPTGDAV